MKRDERYVGSSIMSRMELVAALAVPAILLAMYSLLLGQDSNWDLLNYHLYVPYRFLNGGILYDYFPAQLQTYLSPLPHIPYYLLYRLLSPRCLSVVIGAIQAINLSIVYVLARDVFRRRDRRTGVALALIATVIGATGSVFLSEIGTSLTDSLLSILILASLLLGYRGLSGYSRRSGLLLMLSGFLLGVAIGLKLTHIVFLLPFIVGYLAFRGRIDGQSIAQLAEYTGGAILGFVLAYTPWGLFLATRFGNPFFPFYNGVFLSPYAQSVNWRDTRWMLHSWMDIFVYPIKLALGAHHVTTEVFTRDPRYLCLSAGLLLVAARAANGKLASWLHFPSKGESKTGALASASTTRFILTFIGASYLLWLIVFTYGRYAIPVELLTGIAFVLIIDILVEDMSQKVTIAYVLGLSLLIVGRPASWGRIPWGEPIAAADSASVAQMAREDALYLLGENSEPISYVVLDFPKTARFIRLSGNHLQLMSSKFDGEICATLSRHTGPIYYLELSRIVSMPTYAPERDNARVTRFGIKIQDAIAFAFSTRIHEFSVYEATFHGCS